MSRITRTRILASLVVVAVTGLVASCGGGSSGGAPPVVNFLASAVLAQADWNNAVTQTVQAVENPNGSLAFVPADLTFAAGVPVVLTIENSAGNSSKHYYTAADFYKSVAWRKAQTSQAEYKAPYFKAFELLVGGSIDLYFIPIVPGTYDVLCTIPGHAAQGMTGTIRVTGSPATLDQEISPTWNVALDTDARTSGSHDVWSTAQVVQIDMEETAFPNVLDFSTTPRYARDQGYIVKLRNPGGNQSKHYYSAPGFNETCVLRKAQDSDAEIKAPYLREVELLFDATNDKEVEIFMVPTVAGSYQATCTLTGHAAAGMDHTFTVDPVGTAASSLIPPGAQWPALPTHIVVMDETAWPNLSFSPSTLNFSVGELVVLRISNPSGNQSKHYYTASEFYKSVAWRKAQTSQAEYKAPYFKAFELLVGGSVDLYFVPQIAGTFDVLCTIPGHAGLGMVGSIVVTGDAAVSLDLEISPTWDRALDTDARTSGSNDVWTTAQTVQIDMEETAFPNVLDFSTTPRYARDQGYILKLRNPGGNVSKHYYSAPAFNETCVLRKAQDADAEIKAPYLREVELLFDATDDKELEIFMVPTAAGSFQATCTITGHAAAGMDHTFTVDSVGTAASSLVPSSGLWPAAPTHIVSMDESGLPAALSFNPSTLNFNVGELVILRITNPPGNSSKHYYTAPEFYKSVAWRKAQTSHAEYKAPYFKAFELVVGGTIDLYIVPQIAGTYEVTCTIPGHAGLGMVGSIVVTGDAAASLDLEISSTWDRALDTDPRTSGSDAVWAAATAQTITIAESPSFSYVPSDPQLTAGGGHVLTIRNPTANSGKHYYWSPAFFETCVTRKFQDADAEIKAPYFHGVELLYSGTSERTLEMFVVPVLPGNYNVECTIVGHAAAGMTGTIRVP